MYGAWLEIGDKLFDTVCRQDSYVMRGGCRSWAGAGAWDGGVPRDGT